MHALSRRSRRQPPGGGLEQSTAQTVGEKLRKIRKLTARELPFLKRQAPIPCKITLPAPSNFLVTGEIGQ